MAVKCNPYHSVDREVYHIYKECTVGNNIEKDKRRIGDGGNRLCKNCEAIKKGLRKR